MSHIVFDESLHTGIDGVDEQHATLIEIYNRLDEAYRAGRANREMREILAHLYQYTKFHFEAEEILMARHGYEDYEAHFAEHRELAEQLRRFVTRYTKKEERISSEILDFVSNWVTHHIRESDMHFASAIRERMTPEDEGHLTST